MKYFLCCFVVFLTMGVSTPTKNKRLTEDEFEELFHLPKVTDPVEKARREQALAEAQAEIERVNEDFRNGKKTWEEQLYEFSNLPTDEFVKQKTGALVHEFGMGELEPIGSEEDHEESESVPVPASYDSVKMGHVTPVRDQNLCGSCVAFASMAAIETCFTRVTGVFSDFSEQQLLDCSYGDRYGANGCNGAWIDAYFHWLNKTNNNLLAEATYPYENNEPALTCPTGLPSYNRGAKVTNYVVTRNGTEETLKKLVAKHGAVVTFVAATPWSNYKDGIFWGCNSTTNNTLNHAVAVVGYGTDRGMDYWILKNSWGANWGENGYIRLQRGVGMCGVGKEIAYVKCEAVSGPTSATLTTEAPCHDNNIGCKKKAETSCYNSTVKNICPKSCGLCKGMTPVLSNTCYDEYSEYCADKAKTDCYKEEVSSKCKKSCGLCAGMTPVPSNTCYDEDPNCDDLAKTDCYMEDVSSKCKKSCGLCEGMTPVPSNTCYDEKPLCVDWANTYCYQETISSSCKKSCGLCAGMTPARSYTCYDKYSNCHEYCGDAKYADQCKKACGKC